MRLADFDNTGFDRGRPRVVEALWRILEGMLFNSWLPGSGWRVWLLRRFGAAVGRGVAIKPHVRVKFPWRLRIGDHTWIGESVWIDNLAEVTIGSNCCISQGVYLCTGNHRWDKESFDLEIKPIVIEDECWVGAMARIAPGVLVREGAVIAFGAKAVGMFEPWQIYSEHEKMHVRRRPTSSSTG